VILSAGFPDNLGKIRERQFKSLEVVYGTEYETIDSDDRTSETLDVAISYAVHTVPHRVRPFLVSKENRVAFSFT
jgi:hypothetical protein